jgi:ribonuclease D
MPSDYTYIDTESQLSDLIDGLRDAPRYGIDTEFHRERTYYPQLGLLQIAFNQGVFLIDPLKVSVAPLKEILEGPGLCIIHACSQDLEILFLECGAIPTRLFDPQIAGGFAGFGLTSLARLEQELLGIEVSKGAQLTDWLRRPLGAKELAYAAGDVSDLFALQDAMIAKLESTGRLAWAEEEMERARIKERGNPDPERIWWKVKGSNRFRGTTAAIAQTVCAWRERKAAELDRPRKQIIPDVALLSIIQSPPQSEAAFKNIRGLHPRHNTIRFAGEILDAIAAGKALEREEVNRQPSKKKTATGSHVNLAMTWTGEVTDRIGIEGGLLASRADVSDLASGNQSRLDDGWRHELLGADLKRLLKGEVSIRCEAGGSLTLVDAV